MGDELETQETQATQETAPQPDELEATKAQLAAEQATLAAAQATLTEKDDTITRLEAHIIGLQQGFDDQAVVLAQVQQANTAAVAKYLGAVRAANAALPADVITGATIEAIDVSFGQAVAIADAVRATLADDAKKGRVPAGAPTRVISLEGLTSSEKIALGLQQQKGGAS